MNRASCFDVPQWHEILWEEQDVKPIALGDEKAAGFTEGYMPELFHRLYAEIPAEIEEKAPAAAMRARLHDLASELPEFTTLRKQTVRDLSWASAAAQILGEQVAIALPKPPEAPPDADRAQRILDGMKQLADQGLPVEKEIAQAEAGLASVLADLQEQTNGVDESAVRSALRRGIQQANDDIEAAQTAGDAFGIDAHADPALAIQLAKRVKSSPKLKDIVKLAGRLQATARAKRATKSEYARSELVGVEQTGDLGALLPSELGSLADPTRTADLVRRLGEHSALGYQVRGKERTVSGPIIVAIDSSGSMAERNKDTWAKAVALAVLDVARHERRAFGVCLFTSQVVKTALIEDPAKANLKDLLDLFCRAPDGGTNFEPAMTWALEIIGGVSEKKAFKKADVILVTDGESYESGAEKFKKAADEMGVHVFGIAIDCGSYESLKAWTHECTAINDVGDDTKATDLIFEGL